MCKQKQHSKELCVAAQKEGLLGLLFYAQLFKYRDNYNPVNRRDNPFNDTKKNNEHFDKLKKSENIDRTGGYFSRSKLRFEAKRLGVSENTLRITLGKLVKQGWARRTTNGWVLVSMNKIASSLGVELTKFKIKAKNLKEFKEKIAYVEIAILERKVKIKTLKTNGIESATTLSCKELAKRLGYKSAMTGVNRERSLEKKLLLGITRHQVMRTEIVNEVGVKQVIFKRDCNNLKVTKINH